MKSPVVQTDDYYPFGLSFNSYSKEQIPNQRNLYNGKEIQDELNLGVVDYGARQYMPDIGRFNKPDIFSAMSSSNSPYAYAGNNPINATDMGGNFQFPAEFREKFPKVTAYLERTLPLLQYNETIVNSINKHTNLDKENIRNDLQNASGPRVTSKDFEAPHGGNNYVIGRVDLNEKDLLSEFEKKLNSTDPCENEVRDAYAFMIILTLLHEYVHEASKRTNYRLSRGWGNDGHDEGSNWEYEAFGRYIDYPTQGMAHGLAKEGKEKQAMHNSVDSYMRDTPSMGIYIVIQNPSNSKPKKKSKDADRERGKETGGAH